MYACVDIVYMPWHIWGSQRTMFGNQFSPSTRRVSEMNSSHQSRKQVLSSTEPSCQPHLHLFFYFTLQENPVHSNNRQMLTSGLCVGWKRKDAKIQRAASFTVVITLWMLKKVKIHQTTCLKPVQIITGQLYPSKAVKQLAKDNIYKDQ